MKQAFRYLTAVAWVLVLAIAPAVAQRDFSDVEITTTEVAEGVYMLEGAGGNMGLSVGDDAVLLIDDQFAPLTDKIVAAVREIDERPIRFVLNTHWHFDHVGGNENLGKAGVLIIAHDTVRERLSVDQVSATMGRTIEALPEEGLPVVTFSEDVTFHINGDEIVVFHVDPAHTDGDSIVHFRRANVIHMGDVFFSGRYPFIDISAGGSLEGMISACDRVLELADDGTRIIPGHGPLSGKPELEAYRDMLAGVRDAVKPLVMAGKTLEEVRAVDPLVPFNATWGARSNPGRFLALVYESLSE
jgi:glyoxylase-like metal-dependent hydrolase (beta-lactamase superfamily II)